MFLGEVLENIGKNIFYTVFPKSELISLTQHFDKVKSFYARIRQRREELVNVIRHDEQDDDMEASKLEEMSKRDEIFNPLVKQVSKEEDPYDKRFKKLVMQHVPQYTVHSYKTSVVMNQKSPWAVLKRKQSKRTSLARKQRSVLNTTTPSEGGNYIFEYVTGERLTYFAKISLFCLPNDIYTGKVFLWLFLLINV